MKTLDLVLIILAVFLFVFVVAMMVTFWKFQSVPEALIYAVMGNGGIELISTTFITINKLKKGNKRNSNGQDV